MSEFDADIAALQDIRFREKMRGYHPDDVDPFVEKALALIDRMQRKLS